MVQGAGQPLDWCAASRHANKMPDANGTLPAPHPAHRHGRPSDGCGGPWTFSTACQQQGVLGQPFMCQVCRSWAALDRLISKHVRWSHVFGSHTRERLSGGIFLYEKQAAHTISLVLGILKRRGSATVCETGFNAGHMALLVLTLPNTSVVTFDVFDRSYQRVVLRYLQQTLGLSPRLKAVTGDSLNSVGNFAEAHRDLRCDLAHPSVPGRENSDLLSLRALSRRGAWVMPTALGRDNAEVYGPRGSWPSAIRDGLIVDSRCAPAMRPRVVGSQYRFTAGPMMREALVDHIFCAGRYTITPPLHSGLVMTELGQRVLARSIAKGTIVLLGRPQPKHMLERLAHSQGHAVISVDDGPGWSHSLAVRVRQVDWVLLLFLDSGGEEGSTLNAALRALRHATITYIVVRFHPTAVMRLLDGQYNVMLLSCTHMLRGFGPNALLWPSRANTLNDTLVRLGGHAYVFATQGYDLAIPSRLTWMRRKCSDRPHPLDTPPGLIRRWQRLSSRIPPDVIGWSPFSARRPVNGSCSKRRVGGESVSSCKPSVVQEWYSHVDPSQAEAACQMMDRFGVGLPEVVCTTRVLVSDRPKPRSARDDASPKPNLLVLLIDPISRPQLRRSLPRTLQLLQTMQLEELTRYTAVGNNSGPNQAALYRGTPLLSRRDLNNSTWLWDRLSQKGYATFKGEDGCILNSNFLSSIHPRTTHGSQLKHLFCFGAPHRLPGCLGRRSAPELLLKYTEQYVRAYSKARIPWAAFVHFVDSHEDASEAASRLDEPIVRFLEGGSYDQGQDTIVIVTSDHGLHYGPYFNTEAGRRERAQPVLHIRLPELLRRRGVRLHADNLNQRTTALDLHETLAELLGTTRGLSPYGQSLLHAMPPGRSCEASGIPRSLCEDALPSQAGSSHTAATHTASSAAAATVCVPLPVVPSVFSFFADMGGALKPSIRCRGGDRFAPRSRLITLPGGVAVVKMPSIVAASSELNCLCASASVPWRPCLSKADRRAQLGASPEAARTNLGLNQSLVNVMTLKEDDHFALVKCGPRTFDAGRGFAVHHRLVHHHREPSPASGEQPAVSERAQPLHWTSTAAGVPEAGGSRLEGDTTSPSVLIIEIDSLSREGARRHLPQLNQLLDTHPVLQANYVDVELQLLGVAGSNSVPNQVALLAGCTSIYGNVSSSRPPEGHVKAVESRDRRGWSLWCPKHAHHGALAATASGVPWLFGVAKELGYATFFGEEMCADGSPWAIDALIEESRAKQTIDHSLNEIYCRLAMQMRRRPWPKRDVPMPQKPPPGGIEEPLFMAEFKACIGDSLRFDWPLNQIERLWRARADVPKFAFYSSSVLHDNVGRPLVNQWEDGQTLHKRAALEAYEGLLCVFLTRFLQRHPDTLILLRGDHGQQGGQERIEFDMQVEHRLPYGRLLVPSRLVPNVSLLRINAKRLISPLDLHATLLAALLRGSGRAAQPAGADLDSEPIDLLQVEVPALRTCRQARIPDWLCPCQQERLAAGDDYSYGPTGVPDKDQIQEIAKSDLRVRSGWWWSRSRSKGWWL